jgi:transposase
VYLRHTTRWKDGKAHTYWRLVRSVRRDGKVVQDTVAQLGELDAQGRAKARALARQITGRGDQRELFEQETGGDEVVRVCLDQLRLERSRVFGVVWLGWTLWRALELDRVCEEVLAHGRESVPWPLMASILAIARLCEPSSELHLAEDWYRRTALEDVLGVAAKVINEDRLYRALDQLLPQKAAIEQHLVQRLGTLFALDYDLLLYDVTSTYFEGEAAANALAQRGYSRDHRPDCVQVNIALVVTRQGVPLGYELFAGNAADVTTVQSIVETMEQRYGKAKRIWVMDRGVASKKNVAWLQAGARRYVLGTPRSEWRRWAAEFASSAGWQEVGHGVEAKLCEAAAAGERFLLCRSKDRQAKEHAMHERFARRIATGLERMQCRLLHARRTLDRHRLERQIGRLLERNARAARRYRIELVADTSSHAGVRLSRQTGAQWETDARAREGCYILRTNVREWTPKEIWQTYIQLTEAEAAFRVHKSDLSVRPIWHHKTGRVEAHILVCFLAYVLWKTLEQWQARAGLGNSPRTILEELARIHSTDVVLPLANHHARELRLRCVVRPDKTQAALLDRLGLRLPERLKIPPTVAPSAKM